MPGEREMARLYDVNAKTVSKALGDLAGEGVLVRVIGRGTFVAGQVHDHPSMTRERRYRWLTTAGWSRQLGQRLFARAEGIAREAGHQLHMDVIEPNADGELPEKCLAPGDLRGVDGLAIFSASPSHGLLADLLRRHIPVVLSNSKAGPVKTNAVMPDYARGAFELCEHLIQLGCERIELAWQARRLETYDVGLSGRWFDSGPIMLKQAMRGYQTAMRRHGLTLVDQAGDERQRSASNSRLAELFAAPDQLPALICAGTEAAQAVLDEVAKHRLSVPSDLSMVLLAEPGQTGELDATVDTIIVGGPPQPPLTAYEFDAETLVDWTMRLLMDNGPGPSAQEVIIPGTLVDRGSAKPVPGQQNAGSPKQVIL